MPSRTQAGQVLQAYVRPALQGARTLLLRDGSGLAQERLRFAWARHRRMSTQHATQAVELRGIEPLTAAIDEGDGFLDGGHGFRVATDLVVRVDQKSQNIGHERLRLYRSQRHNRVIQHRKPGLAMLNDAIV